VSIDVDDPRDDAPAGAFVDATARPLRPTEETARRWEALPWRERIRDSDYMRMLQSRRTSESLSASGKLGFEATAERYGYDAAMEFSARFWREHPERASEPERRMTELLARQGQVIGRDYSYIHKAAPGVWTDYAWPDQMKYIEVWGGIHNQEVRERLDPDNAQEKVERESERIELMAERGWTGKVVMGHELKPGQLAETERHVRLFLDPRPMGEKPAIPGVFEPARGEGEQQLRYAAERRLESLLLERGEVMSVDYARDFRVGRGQPVSFAWIETHRAVQIYPDRAAMERDADTAGALRARGWELLQLARDPDLLPENEAATADAVLGWGRPGAAGDPDRAARTRAESSRPHDDVPF
jgi:hypothetical protein